MEAKHRQLLRKHRMDLCSGMNSDLVVSRLVSRKVLNVVDKEVILSEASSIKKNEKILDVLVKRGPKAFQSFIDILNEIDLPHLSSLLGNPSQMKQKETGNDTLDGRPEQPQSDEKATAEPDVTSPASKQTKMDEGLDSTDTPPTPKEEEDGRFGGFGGKKKADVSNMDMDIPSPHIDTSFNPLECYSMKTTPRGRFLLINNKEFLPESGMAPYTRNGTDVDAQCMKELFEELGYIVDYHRNVSVYEIRKAFKRMAGLDYSRFSAFACCVLTHGQEGILYGTDATVDIKELTAFFRGKNLAGKPKMFFFQACQGSEYMDAVERDGGSDEDETDGPPEYGNDITLPTEADFLYAYSTVPGYYSWRNSAKGSWFIQAIVEVFRKYAHKMDVVRMLTRVNQIVSTKKSQTGQRGSHHKRQISSVITQLRKEIYLIPPHGPLKSINSDY